ncbi:MAG TPA: hypothetical protein VKA15_18030 [Isosphaeraceae bacterium]|nr:hypothetical protein [Isosphaeraceae bacterium]
MIRSMTHFAVCVLSVLSVPCACGQATAKLPKAEDVLDHYVAATGGKAAYEKLTNRVSRGTLDIVAANIKGKLTVTQAAPNKLTTLTDLGPVGTSRQGTDGQVVWESSTISGERILEGEEKDTALMQAIFNGELHWQERFVKAECVAVEDVDGKPAAKILLSRKNGKPIVEYYDTASHLLVKQVITTMGPMGEMTIEQYPGDYKKFDGVLIATSLKQKVLGQEIVLSFTDIKHNVKLPADTFALPKEIVEIQAKKAK